MSKGQNMLGVLIKRWAGEALSPWQGLCWVEGSGPVCMGCPVPCVGCLWNGPSPAFTMPTHTSALPTHALHLSATPEPTGFFLSEMLSRSLNNRHKIFSLCCALLCSTHPGQGAGRNPLLSRTKDARAVLLQNCCICS